MKVMRTHQLREIYQRHERLISITFFVLGFLLDVISLGRIDSAANLIQQAAYLFLAGGLIFLDYAEQRGGARLSERTDWLGRAWTYREVVIHFILGSLLSVYTLFYFKSASIFTSAFFLAVLCGLMVANELERFRGLGPVLRMALWMLCLLSYLLYLFPILFGFVGVLPFTVSVTASLAIGYGIARLLRRRVIDPKELRLRVLLPLSSVPAVFVLLYSLQAIPPVPLSASYIGIYHEVRKENGKYLLSYSRPWWKFWQKGDQTFLARPGDRLFCFVRIFSPTRFEDEIRVRWLSYDARWGWKASDAIPIKIVGGREEGYRGYTFKSNYQPGDWRVQVETTDGRELGRIYFTVENDEGLEPRQFEVEEQ